MKTIAIDLDDTLNDFTATLLHTDFLPDEQYPLPEETFRGYLEKLRSGAPDTGELLVTEYSFFRQRIHLQCYALAKARPGAVAFMQWLRAAGWRIVVCSYRDMRRSEPATRKWLEENDIPFDHLFRAGNKIVFCRVWGIGHLVDDDIFNITHGPPHGVQVYYPVMDKHQSVSPGGARGFRSFGEVKTWIQE